MQPQQLRHRHHSYSATAVMTMRTSYEFSRSESGSRRQRGSLARESPYVTAFVVILMLITVTAPTTFVSASTESFSNYTDEAFSTSSKPSLDTTSGSGVGLSSIKTDTSHGASDAASSSFSEATSASVTNADSKMSTNPVISNTGEMTTKRSIDTQSSTDLADFTTETEDMTSASRFSITRLSSTDNVFSKASLTDPAVSSASEIGNSSVTTDASPSPSYAISNTLSKATSPAITSSDSEATATSVSGNIEQSTTGQSVTTKSSIDVTVATTDTDDTSSALIWSTREPSSTDEVQSTVSQTHQEVTSAFEIGNSSVITDASPIVSNTIPNTLFEATTPVITNPDSEQTPTPVSGSTEENTTGEFLTTPSLTDLTVVVPTETEDTSSASSLSTNNPSRTDEVQSKNTQTHQEVTSASKISDSSITTDVRPIASDTISGTLSEATTPAKTNLHSEQITSHASGNTERRTTGESVITQSSTDLNVVTTDTENTWSASILSTSDPSSTEENQSTTFQTHQEVSSASGISNSSVTTDASFSASDVISSTLSQATTPTITNPDSEQTTTLVSDNTQESTTGEFFITIYSSDHTIVITDAEDASLTSRLSTSDHSSTDDLHKTVSQPHVEVTSGSGVGDSSVTINASPSASNAISSTLSETISPSITIIDSEQSTTTFGASTEEKTAGEFLTTQSLTDHTAVTTDAVDTSATLSFFTTYPSNTDDFYSSASQPQPEATSKSGIGDSSVTTNASHTASDATSTSVSEATLTAMTNPDSGHTKTPVISNTEERTTDELFTIEPLTDNTIVTTDAEDTSSASSLFTIDPSSTDEVHSTASQTHQDITSAFTIDDSSVTTDTSPIASEVRTSTLSEAITPAITNSDSEHTTTLVSGNTVKSTTDDFFTTQSLPDHTIVTTDAEDMSSMSSLSTSDHSSTDDVHNTASQHHPEVTSGTGVGNTFVTADPSSSASHGIFSTLSEAFATSVTNLDPEQSTTPASANTDEITKNEFLTTQSSSDLSVVTSNTEDTSSATRFSTIDPVSFDHVHSTASQPYPEVTSGSGVEYSSVTSDANPSPSDAISNTLSKAISPAITITDSEQSSTPVDRYTDSIATEESFTTQSSSGHTGYTGNRSSVSDFSTIVPSGTDDVLSTASLPHPELTSGSEVGRSSVTTHGNENTTDFVSVTHSEGMSQAMTKPDPLQSTESASTNAHEITTVHTVSFSIYYNATADGITTPAQPMNYTIEGIVIFSLNYSLLRPESTLEAFKEAVISTIRFISKVENDTTVTVLNITSGSIIVNFRLESNSALQAAQKNMQTVKPEDFKAHLVIEAKNSKSLDNIFGEIVKMDDPKIHILETQAPSSTGPTSAIEDWMIAVIIIAVIVPLAAIIVVVRCVRKKSAKQQSEGDDKQQRQPAFAGGSRNAMDYEMAGGSRNAMYYSKVGVNRNTKDSERSHAPTSRNYGSRRDSLESESSRGAGDLRRPIGAVAIDKPRRSADYDYYFERPREPLDYQGESRPSTDRLMQQSSPYTGDYPWRDTLADLVAAGRSASFDSRRSAAEGARYAGGPWRPNSNTLENASGSQYQPMTTFQRQVFTHGQNQETRLPHDSSRAFPRLVRTSNWSRPAPDYEG